MTEHFYPGGCGCGKLRYRMTAEPMLVHCCHCTDCQCQTGSGFVLNGFLELDNLVIESGRLNVCQMPTGSGRPLTIHRCAECGTAIYSDYGGRVTMIFVRMTTLDDRSRFGPDVHIYTRSKLPWVTLPPDVPAYEDYYPELEAVWPPEALARRRALGF
jgi:hypothetical protein